jgi:hypothetical protein
MEIIMAEISQVQVLDGSVYDLKDSTARDTLENVSARTPIALGVKSLTSSGGTVTWTSDYILDDSTVHLYSSVYGITATDVAVSKGTITATFPPASSSYIVNATVDGTAYTNGGSAGTGSDGTTAGVTSFNGRTGIVAPQTGDYSYSMITGTPSNATTTTAGLMSAADKTKLSNTNVAYAICSTAAATSTKTATVSGNKYWTLTTGAIIAVKYSYTDASTDVCTLNVNDTGAKYIWYNDAQYSEHDSIVCGCKNKYTFYMYDGTYWVWLGTSSTQAATYEVMVGATSSTDGSVGMVPNPKAGEQEQFLRGDGTWATPPGKDYDVATQNANGLMSSTDKTKLDGLATTTKLEIKTLKAGNTNISWEVSDLSTSSIVDFYTSIYGVYPYKVEYSSTSISAEFPEQTSDMQVCAIIIPE